MGTAVSKSFTVTYTPAAALIAVSSILPTNFTSATLPYDATIGVSGSNLINVNRIDFSWTGPSGPGSASWFKGDASWNANVSGITATAMTLRPRVLAPSGETPGTSSWTVTFKDAVGTAVSKSFTVTYSR